MDLSAYGHGTAFESNLSPHSKPLWFPQVPRYIKQHEERPTTSGENGTQSAATTTLGTVAAAGVEITQVVSIVIVISAPVTTLGR